MYYVFFIFFTVLSLLLLSLCWILITKDKDWFAYGFWTPFIVLFSIMFLFRGASYDRNLKLGAYYTSECKLIETNIDNGFLSPNTNRLNCNGIIENVSASDYHSIMKDYDGSLK